MKKGFTFIEVALVVALMGILFSISIPRFGYSKFSSKMNLEKMTKILQADLRYTRWLAVTKNGKYILKIFTESKEYKIFKNAVSDENQITQTPYFDKKVIISVENDDLEVIFESLGNINANSPQKITLTSGIYSYEININPSTGRITIEKKT